MLTQKFAQLFYFYFYFTGFNSKAFLGCVTNAEYS